MWPFPRQRQKAATDSPTQSAFGARRILEPFAGAFQVGESLDVQDVTSYPTLFAVLDRVSSDIGKLPWSVKQKDSDGIGRPIPNAKLARPNHFQTPSQFRKAWTLALLQQGNAVVLLDPELIVLDWNRVTPMVSPSGSVFYKISTPANSLLPERFAGRDLVIPADAVIHDRGACLYNQLIGVPPLTAAYLPAAKNYHILENARSRFAKGNEMGGLLTVPAGLSDEDAKFLRDYWQKTDPQTVRVIGADAKFSGFDAKSTDSQLVEQLQLSDKQVCAPFHVPPFLVGAESLPSGQQPVEYLDAYFRLALQHIIDGMETLLTQGLRLPEGQYVEIDTSALLRMNQQALGSFYTSMVKGGIFTANEARAAFDLPPIAGGESLLTPSQTQGVQGSE